MPRGGARSGAGRKAKDCPGEPLYTYSFNIRLADTGVLNRLGDGNLSLGLRRLIDRARAAGVATKQTLAHEADPPGKIAIEAIAGDK